MVLIEEENVCGYFNFDDGFLVEECEDAEKIRLFFDLDDSEKDGGDIVDMLPNDPFGMEFNAGISNDMDFNVGLPRDPFGMDFDIEATCATITGWIEDFGLKGYGFESDEGDEDDSNGYGNLKAAAEENDDSNFFAELNFVWTRSMELDEEEKEEVLDVNSVAYGEDWSCEWDESSMDDGFTVEWLNGESSMDDLMCFGGEKYEIEHVKDEGNRSGDESDSYAVDIIIFVTQYLKLSVKELITIEQVCKSLCNAVRKDAYLWTSIHIDSPLSRVITNEDLLGLTGRAQGKLRSLSLLNCFKITKDGLNQVLETNLELTKLSVVGSSGLNGESLLHNLKVFNSVAMPGIKRLRIGVPYGLTNEHLEEYKLLLGEDEDVKPSNYKPRFYRAGEIHLSLDNDERAIDIETCPRCQKVRQVYDCPTDKCQAKIHSTEKCRACTSCIERCKCCGCCLDDKAYVETFHYEYICFDCFGKLFIDGGATLPPGQTYFHFPQMGSVHFLVYS